MHSKLLFLYSLLEFLNRLMWQCYSISDGLCASCLVVKGTHAFVEVLLYERRLVLSHHLAEVVEESTKFQEVEVDSAAKRFWNEAVAEEEAESDLSTRLIVSEFFLTYSNESTCVQRLRHFGPEELAWY